MRAVLICVRQVVNVAREKMRAMFEVWCKVHGVSSASKHARKVLPRCISGRWKSVAEVEARLLDMHFGLHDVFKVHGV